MQIDGDVRLARDVRPEKVHDPLCQAAARIAGPELVNVAGERDALACGVMRRDTRRDLMREQVGERNRNDRTLECGRIDLAAQTPQQFDGVDRLLPMTRPGTMNDP